MQRHEYLGIYLYGNPTNKVQRDFNQSMLEKGNSYTMPSEHHSAIHRSISTPHEHIHGWVRSEKEKVPGMHRDYCGADGRVKRPGFVLTIPRYHSPTLDFDCEDSPF